MPGYRAQRRIPLTKPPFGTRLGENAIARSLVGFWALNEGGGAKAYDSTTGGNHGSFVNSPAWGFQSGTPKLNFVHASAQGVLLKNGPIIGGMTNWSIIALLSTSSPGFNAVYCERAASGNDILKMIFNSHNASLQYRNDGGTLQTITGTALVDDGNLHLWVGTKAGTAMKLYVDGKLDTSGTFGSASDAFTNAGIKSQIGLDAGDSTVDLTADVVYVGVCNVTLSPGAVADLYVNRYSMFNNPRRILKGATAAATKKIPWPLLVYPQQAF